MLGRNNFFCCRNVTTVENGRRSAALLCSFSSLLVSYFLNDNLQLESIKLNIPILCFVGSDYARNGRRSTLCRALALLNLAIK